MPKSEPILSAINTPGYNAAKFLVPMREPLTHNEFTINDAFNFAKEMTMYQNSLYKVCLDVEPLYTNFSLSETINNCVSDQYKQNLFNGKLSKRDIFKLLEIATSESSFIFDYLLYKQVDGVIMGFLLGPTLASAFLCYCEKKMVGQSSNPL